jgi:hypothetical protein
MKKFLYLFATLLTLTVLFASNSEKESSDCSDCDKVKQEHCKNMQKTCSDDRGCK